MFVCNSKSSKGFFFVITHNQIIWTREAFCYILIVSKILYNGCTFLLMLFSFSFLIIRESVISEPFNWECTRHCNFCFLESLIVFREAVIWANFNIIDTELVELLDDVSCKNLLILWRTMVEHSDCCSYMSWVIQRISTLLVFGRWNTKLATV